MSLWTSCALMLGAILLVIVSEATQKTGRIINCPGHTPAGIDLEAEWTPYELKPNTEYTISATLKVLKDIEQVKEGVSVWIPQKPDPIYVMPERTDSCSESSVMQALKFVNLTCPLKAGTHRTISNLKQFLPGTQAAITGDFIVQAYLKDLHGVELGCWRANITISN